MTFFEEGPSIWNNLATKIFVPHIQRYNWKGSALSSYEQDLVLEPSKHFSFSLILNTKYIPLHITIKENTCTSPKLLCLKTSRFNMQSKENTLLYQKKKEKKRKYSQSSMKSLFWTQLLLHWKALYNESDKILTYVDHLLINVIK